MSQSSVEVVESTQDEGATTLTTPTPVQPSLTTPTLPASNTDNNGGGGGNQPISTTTRIVPASSTSATAGGGAGGGGGGASSTTTVSTNAQGSSTTRTVVQSPTTSTSVSVVLVTSVITEGGSTFTRTSSSSSTSLLSSTSTNTAAGSNSGSSGLSTSARNAVIGSTVGVGGAIILGVLAFLIARYIKKRKSDYTPGEDDIRWPEEAQDTGVLFTPAVRQTGGAGLGREMSMRSTVAPSITTAGIPAAYSTGRPTTIAESDNGYAENHSDHSGTGLAPMAGYYDQHQQQPQDHRYSYQPQQNYGGYYHEPQDRQDYAYPSGYEASIRSHTGPLRSTNHSNLDDVSEYGGR